MITIDTTKVNFIQEPFNSGSSWIIRIFFSHYYVWVAYRWSKSSDGEEMYSQGKLAIHQYKCLQDALDRHSICKVVGYQASGISPLGIGQDKDL